MQLFTRNHDVMIKYRTGWLSHGCMTVCEHARVTEQKLQNTKCQHCCQRGKRSTLHAQKDRATYTSQLQEPLSHGNQCHGAGRPCSVTVRGLPLHS